MSAEIFSWPRRISSTIIWKRSLIFSSSTVRPTIFEPAGTLSSVRKPSRWYLVVRLASSLRGFSRRIGTKTL